MHENPVIEDTVTPEPTKRILGLRRRDWVALCILIGIALLLRANFRQGAIQGASMEPTYHNGDTVLVWKSVPRNSLKPGDVIIFRDKKNGDELIKRIALIRPWSPDPPQGMWALPNGGRLVPFSLLFRFYFLDVRLHRTLLPSPDRNVYVLGDNLPVSDDSRMFGPISRDQILGKVIS